MMRTYHDHEDDEYLDVRSDMHHNNVFHGYNNGPDPRYYRNAPRPDEGHINASSDECKTSCSMSRRSPDHSPKCNAAVGTTIVHDNERDCFEDERDAPEEEDFDYREDEYYTTDEQESHWQGSYLTHHNHPVPAFENGKGTHVFVPVDGSPHGYYHHDSHHPDGHYYHHQPRFPDPRYDIYHQHHVYGHHQQQHPSHPQPPPEYASAPFRHEEHVNDPGYYTNAFDAPLPEQVQNAPPPPPPQENVDPPTGATREYGECDVLCGRGALMIWHPGNQYFRSLVQKYRQRYFFSRRQEKKKIASQIIDGVREAGGRFLRRSQASDGLNEINVWVEIDEERAYQKCCQALREGAPEIRRQWRNKPDARGKSKADESKENDDNAASR